MESAFGHRWRSMFKTADDLAIGKQVWASKLGALSKKQLRRGVDHSAMLADWNPSLSEFVRMACDLPTFEQCYVKCLDKDGSDPVTYRVLGAIGSWRMQQTSEINLRPMIRGYYESIYKDVLAECMGCDEVFEPVAALPDDVEEIKPPVDTEAAEKHIQAMKDALNT